MRLKVICLTITSLFLFAENIRADDAQALAREAVKAAGGEEKLLKMFRWKETWFLGEGTKPNPREAIIVPPAAWYQNGKNIAEGNQDRTEKTYMVWVWSLGPLLDPASKLTLLPEGVFQERPIIGLRLSRDKQKDIDLYFDKETKRLARLDWRSYQIDFADWKETDGFHYPAKAFVRHKDGRLYLRTEFLVLERLTELPPGLVPVQ